MNPLAKKSRTLIWKSWRIDDELHAQEQPLRVHLQERDNTGWTLRLNMTFSLTISIGNNSQLISIF